MELDSYICDVSSEYVKGLSILPFCNTWPRYDIQYTVRGKFH